MFDLSPHDRQALVSFLQDMVRIPSPSSQEGAMAERLAAEMRAVGFDEVWTDRVGNVVGRIGPGSGPRLFYDGHMDTVGVGDPAAWAREAANAGMKYFVVTTKHHDGFCLWDSALTDYKAPNTPAGRDVLQPMVEAFRAQGFKVGFYHSVIDWHHPEFPVDGLHPQRDDVAFREAQKGRDIRKYAEYLHGQSRELLTQFGKISIM